MNKNLITLKTPGKINIGLILRNKRSDGYHDIETLFLPVELYDEITVNPECAGFKIICKHPDVPEDEQNLVYKAADLLMQQTQSSRQAEVTITKNIPVAAGMAGGSTDAACALKILNNLWNLHVSNGRLKKIAMLIGSDVPFFLDSGPAIGTGRGEVLHPVQWRYDCHILLVIPLIKISAQWAYEHNTVELPRKEEVALFSNVFARSKSIADFREYVVNDLEGGVFAEYPVLADIKQALYDAGADYAAMAGSGSTMYGLFTQKKAAESARKTFKNGYETVICKPLLSV